jgi:inorganic pyrophosphatase
MYSHIFDIGNDAPRLVNTVIDIPKSPSVTKKLEVDLADGEIVNCGQINPPLETFWHYGSIPETLGDEGEAIDILVVDPGSMSVSIGQEITARPIGVLRILDGWETRDDKIIAVPASREYDHLEQLTDLTEIPDSDGKLVPLRTRLEEFFQLYRQTSPLTIIGWGDVQAAQTSIAAGQRKYSSSPLAKSRETAHIYASYLHVFLPPPPKHCGPTRYVEDIEPVRKLFASQRPHPDYGFIVSGIELKKTISSAGYNMSRSRLIGHNRERLIEERLRMADVLKRHGAKVFTASNDTKWLERAGARGVVADFVDQENYEVENVAGISAQDLKTIQFQRADGTRVVITEAGVDEQAIRDRLKKIDVGQENEPIAVLNMPDRMIPWEVPSRGPTRMTQLTNWIDYGVNIWPDRDNQPHLVINEALEKIALFQGRAQELYAFMEHCKQIFAGVHLLRLTDGLPYGSPTNSIDVGAAIICNTSLSDASKTEMENILDRPIDNSLHIEEDAPGLRCAIVPIDKVIYSVLLEGDPLHHAAVDRRDIDPLDPMDAFFDVHGPEHQSLAARVQERRTELGDTGKPNLNVKGKRRGSPVRG